jgi:uncharacterized membrane protein
MRILLLAVLGTSVAYADPIEVTVKPASTTWKPKQNVDVTLTVTNTGKTPAKLEVMICSWYESWKSSDAELTWLPWGCDKNAPTTVTLEPGKARDWKLEMFAAEKAKPGAHQLTMTFTPIKGSPTKSKPVTITVAP